jgi:hypothetical protein
LISATVENTGNQRLVFDAVVDHVTPSGQRAHPFPELGAAASHLGLLGEEVESADDDLDDSVGPFRPSVGSDMQPELEEILLASSDSR